MSRRPIAEMVVDRIWRFFCSVRAAVYEIVVLTLMVLAGTLRGSSVPKELADLVPALQPVVDRWYAWDVFHSLPFVFLLTLISVAIAICTINRVPGIWRTIAHPTIVTNHGSFRTAEVNARFDPGVNARAAVSLIEASFRKRHYRTVTTEVAGELHLYADRYRYSKFGTFPFHLALILILVGGIVGARFGFRDMEFPVAEGSTREVGHGTGLTVGLTDFRDVYRDNGTPSEYQSDLVVYRDGEPVKSGSITVNHPLRVDDVVFYQSGFGQAAAIIVTDDQGRELFNDSAPLGILQSKLNPEAPAGIIELPMVNASVHVIGPDTAPNSKPELDTLNLRSGEMFIQVRPADLGAGVMPPSAFVAQGDTVNLNGLNITFVRERQYTILQVGRNPGIPIFWAASFLLVGGLAVVFYFPHRRIRGIIAPAAGDPARSVAWFAPMAKRDWSGQRAFQRVIEEIGVSLGGQAEFTWRQATTASDGSDDSSPERSPDLTTAPSTPRVV
jgi:cytochrome c biogenesis protein